MIIIATWGYPRVPSWPGWHRERSWGSLEEQPHTPGLTGFLLFSTVFFYRPEVVFLYIDVYWIVCIILNFVLFWSILDGNSLNCLQNQGCPLDAIPILTPWLPIGCNINTNTKVAHWLQYQHQDCPFLPIWIPRLPIGCNTNTISQLLAIPRLPIGCPGNLSSPGSHQTFFCTVNKK